MIQASRGARLVTQHPHVMANYGRLEMNIVRGEGCWLFDESGNAYLDLVAGLAVCALGHAHPRIARAIAEQAATLVHVSNLVHHEPAGTLADRLAELSGFDAVFSIFGVIMFPYWRRGLSEMARVTRRGGRGIVATWQGRGAATFLLLSQIRQKLFPERGGMTSRGLKLLV